MKKSSLVLCALFAFTIISHSQTSGILSVTVTTNNAGGNYAPKNVVSIWIEDEAGNFVKTLLAYAQNRKTHLNTWEASTTAAGSAFNTVDAITGPTKSSHGTRTCTWDGMNFIGEDVPDGTYNVWMELTDKNSTGNFSSFSFLKGEDSQTITPFNVPSFESIIISWEPFIFPGIDNEEVANKYKVFPVPASHKLSVTGDDINKIEIADINGTILYSNISTIIDLSKLTNGTYFVIIHTDNQTIKKKIIKQ